MVGSFPNWDRWSEWNGKYRDDVRAFVKGDPGKKPGFATRLAGSADLYNKNNRYVCLLSHYKQDLLRFFTKTCCMLLQCSCM